MRKAAGRAGKLGSLKCVSEFKRWGTGIRVADGDDHVGFRTPYGLGQGTGGPLRKPRQPRFQGKGTGQAKRAVRRLMVVAVVGCPVLR